MQNNSKQIKEYILSNVEKHPKDIVRKTMDAFSITRTTVRRHINALIKEDKLVISGNTQSAQYFLQNEFQKIKEYPLNKDSAEDKIFNDFLMFLNRFPKNIYDICYFGLTEMINNAIDHSSGTKLIVQTRFNEPNLTIIVKDDGLGAFKTICDYLQIDDLREGIVHLSKGKITRDPVNHTGQGIFFTSRMFDQFVIEANGLVYSRDNFLQDWSFNSRQGTNGSVISMTINVHSKITAREVFAAYEGQDWEFSKTEVLIHLSDFNEEMFISRSQAKRVLLGLEKFKQITFDFKRIASVGQGFVDEIFRVFANRYPGIVLRYINANDDVEFMIRRSHNS